MTLEQVDTEEKVLRLRRDELAQEVRNISVQLADRDRVDRTTGKRMTLREYWQWRKQAVYAQKCKQDELSIIKQRIRELMQERDRLRHEANVQHTQQQQQTSDRLDWKPIVMRALAESQQRRDWLLAQIAAALENLEKVKVGSKSAAARAILRRALGIEE
jgi:hypothetical protein